MSLYTIKKEFQAIIDRAESATSEEFQELESELVINQESFKEKALAYTHVIKNYESDISGIDAEIKRLQSMKTAKSNVVEKLEKNIVDAMVMFESEKLDFGTFKLSTRKSESVNTDEAENYIKENGLEKAKEDGYAFGGLYTEKTTYKPNKKEIKELINSGCELKGCFVEKNKSLQIK
jgi:hypothetical protein